MSQTRVFSGVQPSGVLTIGNYLGALKQFTEMQYSHDCVFCVVDLHALTVPQDPETLREQSLIVAGLLLAAGLEPGRVTLFIQSHVPAHAELAWILQCTATFGELQRMTQFKAKSEQREIVTAGLFTYPALMAADILLYDTQVVPVGADQKQHVELTRDIAQRFNGRYGETFVVPEVRMRRHGNRIMSLTDPANKMSKSDPDPQSYVGMLDGADTVRSKVGRAVTDSGREIRFDPEEKAGVSNLLTIRSLCSGKSIADLEAEYEGAGYKRFKDDVAEAVIEELAPVQRRYAELRHSPELAQSLAAGAAAAADRAAVTLERVKERLGLVPGGGKVSTR